MSDALEQDKPVWGALHNDVVELLRTREPAHHAHRDLERLLFICGLLSKLACRDLNVLLLQSIDNIHGGQPLRGQLQRVEPHAHSVLALAKDIHVAHTGHTLDCVFHVDVEIV